MTDSATTKHLAIRSQDVMLQFDRRGRPQSGDFLHAEIAERMRQRLKLIRIQPETVLDAGCGAGERTELLRDRFAQANIISLDHNPRLLAALRKSYRLEGFGRWVSRWKGQQKHRTVCADLATTGLEPESLDMVWSNLALHWHPKPHDVIREWGRILRPEGLAFFSCYGPATAIELRAALRDADLDTSTMPFVDMHDFGDMLVEHGFADPVMDQETLTLTYRSADALLRDVAALGGNASSERRRALPSRQWLEKLKRALESTADTDGRLKLTIEVSYGHAWRQAIRQQGSETLISLNSLRRKGPQF